MDRALKNVVKDFYTLCIHTFMRKLAWEICIIYNTHVRTIYIYLIVDIVERHPVLVELRKTLEIGGVIGQDENVTVDTALVDSAVRRVQYY